MIRVVVLAVVLALLPAAVRADGTPPGVPTAIHGTVTNRTAGVHPVSGVAVTLEVYDNARLKREVETTADAQGHYAFGALSADPAFQYVPVVQYMGVTYRGDPIRLADAKATPAAADVSVYTPTGDDPGLRYVNATLVLGAVDQARQHLSFLELLTLENPSDRTFVPSTSASGMAAGLVRFSLPPGVDDIGVQSGLNADTLIQVDAGLASTAPVIPGTHTISFSFTVPYHGSRFDFAWNVVYPAAAIHVLEPDTGPPLRAGSLGAAPDLSLQGRTFRVLSGGAVPANTTIAITVDRLPSRTPFQALGAALAQERDIAIGALAIAFLAALFPVAYRRRLKSGGPPVTADALLDELVALDRAHDEGTVEERAYHERRAALKARLARLLPAEPEARAPR